MRGSGTHRPRARGAPHPARLAIAAVFLCAATAARSSLAQSPAPAAGSMRELARAVAAGDCARAAVPEREGRPLEAEALYARAVEADPGYLPGHLGYARMLAARGRTDEALRVLAGVPARATELDRDFVDVARVRAALGDVSGALEALAARGESAEALRARAEVAANAGRFPEALCAARRLRDLAAGARDEHAAALLVRALGILVGQADAVRWPGDGAPALRRLLAEP